MAAVVVAGRHPVYELTAADLVVRQLDELSFVNLKQLFRNEELAALNVCLPSSVSSSANTATWFNATAGTTLCVVPKSMPRTIGSKFGVPSSCAVDGRWG